jgi:electron transfer flavoprotein alpha subunit
LNRRILLLAEHLDGRLSPETCGLASLARQWEKEAGCTSSTWVILGCKVSRLADELASVTGLDVFVLDHPSLALYNAEAYAAALTHWLEEQGPWILLLPHSSLGLDLAPSLSFSLGAPYLSGLIELHFEGQEISFTRESLYGKRTERWKPVTNQRVLATVIRQGRARDEERPVHPGTVCTMPADLGQLRTRTLELRLSRKAETGLSRAAVVVAAGRGIGDEKALTLLRELVSLLGGAALGASRPVCDRDWLSVDHQIGMTGQTVSPRLYFAFGISGAIQHLAGMQDSQCIVAVNRDPDAPIFRVAHYGIVDDIQAFLPALLRRIKERKGMPA